LEVNLNEQYRKHFKSTLDLNNNIQNNNNNNNNYIHLSIHNKSKVMKNVVGN
jgi:hypothetical protein